MGIEFNLSKPLHFITKKNLTADDILDDNLMFYADGNKVLVLKITNCSEVVCMT